MTENDDFLVNNPNDINPLYLMKEDEKLAEDNDTPFSPPDGELDYTEDTHQGTSTDTDSHENYDEGIEGAAQAHVPAIDLIPQDDNELDDDEDDDDDIKIETEENSKEFEEEHTEEE